MKNGKTMRTHSLLMIVAAICLTAACNEKKPTDDTKADNEPAKSYFKNPAPPFEVVLGAAEKESAAAEFLDGNKLRKPLQYREWIFIGSRLIAGTKATFENIYMHPRHYHDFRQNHAWPDPLVLVRERVIVEPKGADFVMGKPQGVSVAVRNTAKITDSSGWAFYDFGTTYPLANSAAADGRAWFASPDELLEYCPVIRGFKR